MSPRQELASYRSYYKGFEYSDESILAKSRAAPLNIHDRVSNKSKEACFILLDSDRNAFAAVEINRACNQTANHAPSCDRDLK